MRERRSRQYLTVGSYVLASLAFFLVFHRSAFGAPPSETTDTTPAATSQPAPFPPIHYDGKWIGGVKSGVLIPTQGIDSRMSGSSQDLPVNTSLFYGLTDHWLVGADIDWFSFSVNSPAGNSGSVSTIPLTPSGNVGSFSTVSFTPAIEYRFTPIGKWSPYLTAGLGININGFTQSSCPPSEFSCSTSPQDALGGRVGAGSDWFITPRVALSMEIAYLFDSTTVTSHFTTANGPSTGYGSIDAASVCLLFGVNFKTP